MSTPTFKLPAGYASLKYGTPDNFTEGTFMTGVAVLTGFKYGNKLERKKILGSKGFVAGWTDMVRSEAGNGAGGTKYDTEAVTLAFSKTHGEHAVKRWPLISEVLDLGNMSGDDAKFNGKWSIVGEDIEFARASEADKAYQLERYCDVAL